MIEKYTREDGKVAVLYTGSYGAGWYSWNTGNPELLFDKDIVQALLKEDRNAVIKIAAEKYPEMYTGGSGNLCIEWLDPGCCFDITCFDGKEEIQILGHYLVA